MISLLLLSSGYIFSGTEFIVNELIRFDKINRNSGSLKISFDKNLLKYRTIIITIRETVKNITMAVP